MSLAIGNRLGPYEVLGQLGAGGMGEVYKARDTRLERVVAIKVLPPHTAERPDARQRFEREARAVSALNHPHICTLHDVGNEGGLDYLVMEYLDGETLADRLKRGALPLDQALQTANEVADALDRAHSSGIIHRDLKPGNIMLTKFGAKVLDFGLAKMRAQSAGAAVSAGSMMETLTSPLTGAGFIVGTLQYMSPEQLEGREADARSDIFSFGAVLYEMATGRKPFDSQSQAGLIAQIMQTDPPGISSILPQAPAALEQLARVCLAKDPAARRQTMRDVATDLHWIASPASRPEPAKLAPARQSLSVWIWRAGAVLFAAATVALIVTMRLQPAPDAAVTRFTLAAPPGATFGSGLALSPDGRQLAFIAAPAGRQNLLWIRPLDSLTAREVPGSEGAQHPFWSPDGHAIAFFAQGKLKRVDLPGGPVQVICDANDERGGSWGPDGTILFAPNAGSPLQRVAATGGTPSAITKLDATHSDISHRWPHFLPDGRHYLCFVMTSKADNYAIAVGSMDNANLKILTHSDSAPAFSPPGFVLFVRDSTLLAQRLSAVNFDLIGPALPIAQDVYLVGWGTGQTAAVQFSVSPTGALVYQAGAAQQQQLVWFDRSGKALGNLGPRGAIDQPEISPDGKRVMVDGTKDIWMYDTTRGNASRFTLADAGDNGGVWSPDGSQVLFCSNRNRKFDLYLKPADGGPEKVLLATDEDKNPDDWSRDGRRIIIDVYSGASTKLDLWWLPLDGDRKPAPYLQTPFNEAHGRLSPDGKWLAYASDETGRSEIYVQSFPTLGGKVLISTNGGDQPRWRGDGKELYYLTLDRKLMSVEVTAGATFESGTPKVLFQTRTLPVALLAFRNHYAVTPDGRKFLVAVVPEDMSSGPMVMVLNWVPRIGKR